MKNCIDKFRATTAMFFAAALLAGCGWDSAGNINAPPVANAGSTQNVTTGTLVTLDGSASTDADSNPLTYSWTLTSKPAGSSATLTGATTVAPTFTADVGGTYIASLVVNDGLVDSAPATVSIIAYPAGYVAQGGLIWMPVTLSDTWPNADAYCASFSINGQSGWRMPTRLELSALYASGAMNGQGWVLAGTWSSTPYNVGYHYFIDLNYGTDTWMPDAAAILVSCVH